VYQISDGDLNAGSTPAFFLPPVLSQKVIIQEITTPHSPLNLLKSWDRFGISLPECQVLKLSIQNLSYSILRISVKNKI